VSDTVEAGRAERRPIAALDHTPDAGPGTAARLGLILLSTDLASEHAYRAMVPDDEIAWHVTRVANWNPTTLDNLKLMAGDLSRAAALLPVEVPLGSIAFACTSGVVAMGEEAVFGRIAEGRPMTPATAPVVAALAGFETLGVGSVALLTPYVDEVTEAMADFLELRGVRVAACASFRLASDTDMAMVPPGEIARAAAALDCPAAEAVFVSCTALRAWPVIEALEAELGKPVVTSHQAMLWHGLRLADCHRAIPGYGELLRR
jgi:maleate isomerase